MFTIIGIGMFIFHKGSNIVGCWNILRKVQNRNIVMSIEESRFGSSAVLSPDQHQW